MPSDPRPGPPGPGDRCIVVGHDPGLVHDLITRGAEVHVIGPVRPAEVGFASHHAIDPAQADPGEIIGVIVRVGAVITRLYAVGVDPAPFVAAASAQMHLGGAVHHDGGVTLIAPPAP